MSAPTSLLDRINRVINVEEFEAQLEREDSDMFHFQTQWMHFGSFEALPGCFQRAILAGEAAIERDIMLTRAVRQGIDEAIKSATNPISPT